MEGISFAPNPHPGPSPGTGDGRGLLPNAIPPVTTFIAAMTKHVLIMPIAGIRNAAVNSAPSAEPMRSTEYKRDAMEAMPSDESDVASANSAPMTTATTQVRK